MRLASSLNTVAAGVLALAVVAAGSAALAAECIAERPRALAATDPALCSQLESVIRKPSALPLAEFEARLNQFFGAYCHRNAAAGWVRDKGVRDTGPFIASLKDGAWQGSDDSFHSPVVIWYSPEMAAWLKTNRPATGDRPDNPPPVPDGAVMVKEMFPAPSAPCRAVDPLKLFPTGGAAVMIRDSGASYDGWFWGWYGFGADSGWKPDWPPDNSLSDMGFAQYCLNCHSSARNNLTFADSSNLEGEPGTPPVYLSQDFFTPAPKPSRHQLVVLPAGNDLRLGVPLHRADDAVVEALRAYAATMPSWETVAKMPSETYDNTWVGAGKPDASDTFLTSSQCIGCHDAGSTGLQFDMTMPNPHGDNLINLSPFATWRTSPMGLGGRDPIFFAQLASETQTFHPTIAGEVENICLGCHGVAGQRQFHIDQHASDGSCPDFSRAMVDAVPWPAGNPGAEHANYGMLARDGINCTACHRMAIGEKGSAAAADGPQNACVAERQASLNPGLTGFGATFTGSFFVGDPGTLIGQFEKPKPAAMEAALGIKPVEDPTITNSEICGTCHTVHLPVIQDGKTLARIYEQTTYPEWAFSDFRVGKTPDGADLPSGQGKLWQSCQGCHMSSENDDGSQRVSKIASVQEVDNFPEVQNGYGPNLVAREGFALHTLVGLNVFLVKMAQQFPDVLGIRVIDPMLVSKGVAPLITTEQAMLDQAANDTATISVSAPIVTADALTATVKIVSKTGHKFPSGVGFRRAFVAFSILDDNGDELWASGRTNAAGVIVDDKGDPIDGELWWKDDCSGFVSPGKRPHQPHFQEITGQNQTQIYQELVSTPPTDGTAPICGHDATPAGELTTSFLSICAEVKDNRILPSGYLPLAERIAIARALGAGEDLAADAGSTAVGDDPDYVTGGGDSFDYKVALSDLPAGSKPASVEATLYYQAIPPYYLQDRFCTAKGPDAERLYFLAGHLNLKGTAAEDWKLEVVGTGPVAVRTQ